MSLIIMPGDPEFNEEIKPTESDIPIPYQGDLVGRVMSLNLIERRHWQCGGFSVSSNNPVSAVSPMTQQHKIREAILQGILIDITDQPDKGLRMKGSRTTGTTVEDTGNKVFITVDKNGGMAVMAPDSSQSQDKMEETVNNGDVVIPENFTIGDVSKGAKFRVKPENVSIALDAFTNRFRV